MSATKPYVLGLGVLAAVVLLATLAACNSQSAIDPVDLCDERANDACADTLSRCASSTQCWPYDRCYDAVFDDCMDEHGR